MRLGFLANPLENDNAARMNPFIAKLLFENISRTIFEHKLSCALSISIEKVRENKRFFDSIAGLCGPGRWKDILECNLATVCVWCSCGIVAVLGFPEILQIVMCDPIVVPLSRNGPYLEGGISIVFFIHEDRE